MANHAGMNKILGNLPRGQHMEVLMHPMGHVLNSFVVVIMRVQEDGWQEWEICRYVDAILIQNHPIHHHLGGVKCSSCDLGALVVQCLMYFGRMFEVFEEVERWQGDDV
jgi:hypothetical protein